MPDTAWSFGVNVRFRNGKITSGPVFRSVAALGTSAPRFTYSATPLPGMDQLFLGYLNGRVFKYNGSEIDYSVSGYTPASSEAVWSATMLGNIIYVNRADRAPWYLRPSDTAFQNLGVSGGSPTSWDTTWSCGLLRTCAGALVALNVVKGAISYPTMVKTSSIPLAGATPASWDASQANTLATENIIAEMKGGITDAQNLGNMLVIYGLNESWLMYADNSQMVYSYRKLPFQKGAINANCSLELDGKHYVFGADDIWMHDGTTEVSLIDGSNRDFIFASINMSKKNRCFVHHNAQMKEISFCYVSGDRGVKFLGASDGCNRAAVYNYVEKTWTFDDLPLVYSASNANLSVSVTYATTTATYDTVGGSYLDQEDGFKRTPVFVGTSSSTYSLQTSLYALDLFGQGSTVVFPVDTNATGPRYLERSGIDLDSLNADFSGYKVISSIFPQARLGYGSSPLRISVGAADHFNIPPTYSAYQDYDGDTQYKLDFNTAGRYLSITIRYDDYREMTLTGMDLDLHINGTA